VIYCFQTIKGSEQMPKISDNNLVEKSKSLVWAKFRDYTAGELRLLEVYLSRINPRDPNSSRVEFTLAEYRDLLGLKSLDARRIEPQIKHFLGNTVCGGLPEPPSAHPYGLKTVYHK
jgi:hypothetical protein